MDPEAAADAWETVWQGRGEVEAALVAQGLRDAGIDAVPQGDRAPGYVAPMLGPTRWAVWVREEDLDDARDYLFAHDLGAGATPAEPVDDLPSRARMVIGLMLLFAVGVIAVGLWNAR